MIVTMMTKQAAVTIIPLSHVAMMRVFRSVSVEVGRFSSPEGFFNVDLWEMDYPTLHKLIFQAIQSCPMDNRRHMYRSVVNTHFFFSLILPDNFVACPSHQRTHFFLFPVETEFHEIS
jgi:hypothetical protein